MTLTSMYRQLTDEQRLILETARTALERRDSVSAARAALDDNLAPDLWPLAIELGWAGIMSSTSVGGAGLNAFEAALVLEACGSRLADARLLGHLPAAAVLEAAEAPPQIRAAAADGARLTLVDAALGRAAAPVTLRRDGDSMIAHGRVSCVLDAAGASVLVVNGVDETGEPACGYASADAAGLDVTPVASYDATRETADVTLEGAQLQALALEPPDRHAGRDLQRVLLAAESVGAAEACLAMARQYAIDRVAFGRPIGSYQAIKHKLVEMLRRVENARSVVDAAARLARSTEFPVLANAARVVAADALEYAAPENIFIHGAVGATWEHDASLYYRRAEASRRLAGGPDAPAIVVAGAMLDPRAAGATAIA